MRCTIFFGQPFYLSEYLTKDYVFIFKFLSTDVALVFLRKVAIIKCTQLFLLYALGLFLFIVSSVSF